MQVSPSCLCGGIKHGVIRPRLAAGGHRCGLDMPFAENVEDLFASREQIIGNDAAVTPPPHRFRAHDGATPPRAEFQKLLEALMEGLAERVDGVIVEALVLPEAIELRIDALLSAQATKLGDVLVCNLEIGEAFRQPVAIILRVGT